MITTVNLVHVHHPTFVVTVQSSIVSNSATSWTVIHLSFPISRSLLKLMSIESVMPSNHLILCHPLLLLPPIFPSIRVFSSESALRTRWPKYWSLSFSNNSSNEYSGLISFRIDWFDLQSISPHSDTFFPSMRISRFTLFIGFFFFFGSMTNFLWS